MSDDSPGAQWAREAAERRAAMLARREELSAAHPEITMAAELAPLMGDLEREYWNWQIERYLAQELGEGDG